MNAVKIIMPTDGFHVLAAKQISGAASAFQSEIRIIWEEKNIISDAKSILGIMAMEIKKGTSLTLTFDGPDEEQAMELLILWFEHNANN
ncbi:HPr family phosphocarrier protein [Paenibacillus chitinolyticus]|uniref:Phosphocarrier protein HPr n=1 Tax=Paenibacillus chitinolyticus TaxID=79263 RepID=A0A410WXQ6_9BACL|nr:HPr family phosphocarrier protein [Paenibacillus chitinolyticus]MCY9589860.1 HPr family phosphocarrier protein [Paenibacillus chitinolyticus]MCY9598139.1 HPr family phosphocarrier protein [Paenibacillus chitinolyticus]QAV19236.1 HPr family phosphocarrier protein [Paenibacillus chitinolyticus]